jgi:diguanylate cyclase (GGDEF)-like protein/PAS domain S-box-containing protein
MTPYDETTRHRHPTAARPARSSWIDLSSPAVVAALVFCAVVLLTVGGVAAQPGLTGRSLLVFGGYGLVISILAAIVTGNLARQRVTRRGADARAMASALEREERLRLIVASLHEGLVFQDRDLRIVEFNEAASQILGLSDLALGRRPQDIAPWHPVLEDGTVLSFEDHPAAVTLRTSIPRIGMTMGVALPGNNAIWVKLNTVPVFDDSGAVDGVLTTFTDVTPEKMAQLALASSEAAVSQVTEALSWQAFHDPLTELPNRAQLVERLTAALDRARHHSALTAVLFLDIDRFKNVNDTLGHEAGDRLLVVVAERLRGAIRSSDMVARLSGDEYIVLAESLSDRTEAVQMADRLRAVVAVPIDLPQGTITVNASIGIAFDVDHRPGTLLRDADTALHKAKEQGRDRTEIFDDSLRAETMRKVAAEQVLRRALDEDGLRVLYQPIVDLTSGEVVAAEALLRILGPGGELLTPTPFIAIGEDTGLIVPIGAGVLDDACRQLTLWREELGDRAPRNVSVNLSARQITSHSFPSVVERTLSRHGVGAASLTLELTETTLIEAGHAALDTVHDLHELGVHLAIDDFGTGYSSLSYLKRFPVDVVKVDRSFVSGLGVQQHDTEIVKAVLALGQSLGLMTVAEGVETTEQLTLLQALRCDYAQGFLLARPIRAEEMGAAIERIHTSAALRPPASSHRTLRLAGE